MLKHRKIISSKQGLYDFKASLPDAPVIYISNDSYLQKLSGTFDILIRKQDRLLAFRIKASVFTYKKEKGLRLFFRKFIENTAFLPWHLLRSLYLNNRTYYTPDYYMCSTKIYLPLKAYFTVERDNILILHSDDVNRIVADTSIVDGQERVGVFLDQILPIAYRGKIDPDGYYDNVQKTLFGLKEYLNLDKIIVSEHPESEAVKEELKNRYQNFERSRRNSHSLIKNADYVFAHYSTSIGMAVYFNKPVILLIDDHLRQIKHIANAIEIYKQNLHLPVVDMGDNDFGQLDNMEIDKSAYQDYVRKFMRDNYNVNENSYHYAIKRIISDLKK
jgi:hypothetical protein